MFFLTDKVDKPAHASNRETLTLNLAFDKSAVTDQQTVLHTENCHVKMLTTQSALSPCSVSSFLQSARSLIHQFHLIVKTMQQFVRITN